MSRLKSEHIISVEQHIFGNIVPCHIRFHEECPDWVGEGLPPGWTLNDLLGMAENANPFKEETKLKTKKEYSVLCTPPSTKFHEKKNKDQTPATEPCTAKVGDLGPVALGDIFREAWQDEYPTGAATCR